MSEVYKSLKNLPGGLHLEKCCKEFESRGFHTLGSLKYLRPGDIDAFFPSPDKLLLAEKHILESEINAIVDLESKRTPLKPLELSQKFNSFSGKNYDAASSYDSQMSPSNLSPLLDISPPTTPPLDRKKIEMKESLLVLEVQISSASSKHTKTTCKSRPCESSNNCKIREKHPEMKAKILSLQAELKELQKQHEKQRSELETFVAAREKSKSSFFSVMRNRLRLQNLPKYSDRLKLDKDLLVLQRALRNEVPNWDPEESDWQLPIIIEQFHHAKVAPYLPVKRYFVDGPFVQHQAGLSHSGASPFP